MHRLVSTRGAVCKLARTSVASRSSVALRTPLPGLAPVSALIRPSLLCTATSAFPQTFQTFEHGEGGSTPRANIPEFYVPVKSKKGLMEDFRKYTRGVRDVRGGIHIPARVFQFLKESGELVYESPGSRVAVAKEMWDMLKEKGWKFNVGLYNTLMQVYLSNDQPFVPSEMTTEMQDNGITPNQGTFNLLLQEYCHTGNLQGAAQILEHLKSEGLPINENVYASLITGHARNGDMTSAEDMLGVMEQNGLRPGLTSYTALLTAYAEKGDLEAIQRVFKNMKASRVFSNMCNLRIVDTLSRHGHSHLIKEVLEQMHNKQWMQRDLHELVYKFATRGELESCTELLHVLKASHSSLGLPKYTGAIMIRALLDKGKTVPEILEAIKLLQQAGIEENLLSELAYELCLKRRGAEVVPVVEELHSNLPEGEEMTNMYLYPVFAHNAKTGDMNGLFDTLLLLKKYDLNMDRYIYHYTMEVLRKNGGVENFVAALKDAGFLNMGSLTNQLLYFIASRFNWSHLPDLIRSVDRETFRLGSILRGITRSKLQYVSVPCFLPVVEAVVSLELRDANLDRVVFFMFRHVLDKKETEEGFQMVFKVLDMGVKLTSLFYQNVILALKQRNMDQELQYFMENLEKRNVKIEDKEIDEVFKTSNVFDVPQGGQFRPDFVSDKSSFSIYITNASKEKKTLQALKAFREASAQGVKLSPMAYMLLAEALLDVNYIDAAEEVRSEMLSNLIRCGYILHNKFLEVYARNGAVANAIAEFEQMKHSDTITVSSYTYSLLLRAYSFHGDFMSVREMIMDMENENIPLVRGVSTALVEAYINCKELSEAVKATRELEQRPFFTTYVGLLEALVAAGMKEEQAVVMEGMKSLGTPEVTVRDILLYSHLQIDGIENAREILLAKDSPGPVGERGFLLFLANAMRKGMRKCVKDALQLFREEKVYRDGLCVAMIQGYKTIQDIDGARSFQRELEENGLSPSQQFYDVLQEMSDGSSTIGAVIKQGMGVESEWGIEDRGSLESEQDPSPPATPSTKSS